MTETFIVKIGIDVSVNERMVDVQLHGSFDEQQLARDRMKYACPACMFTAPTSRGCRWFSPSVPRISTNNAPWYASSRPSNEDL